MSRTKRGVSVRALVISLTVVAMVLATATWYVGFLSGALKAKDEIAALKAAADKPTAPTPPCVTAPSTPFKITPISAPSVAAKDELPPSYALEEPFDAEGDWVVQLHTLFNPYQFSIEKAETFAAFEKCSIETDYILDFCATKIKDQRIAFAALAKGKRGFTARQAVRIADCFNRNMKSAKNRPNAANAVKSRHFAPACMDDKPGTWERPSKR